jgi:plastocyanin
MVRRWAAVAGTGAAVLLIGAAPGFAATKRVYMGTPPSAQKSLQAAGADVNAFFPRVTTVHVGDRVRFEPVGFHTFDFPPRGGDPLPLISPTGQKLSGALDAAGTPFWFNGQDQVGFTPALGPPGLFGKTVRYTGSNRVESGLPLAENPPAVTVRFTKPGRYVYYCDVHPGMKGVVIVRPRARKVSSARADARRVARQVRRAKRVAAGLPTQTPPTGTVDVGNSGPGGVEFFGFLPQTQTVSPGTTLVFRMSPSSYDVHTATTGPGNPENEPDSYLGKLASTFEQPVFDPAAVYPSDPPSPTPTLTPTTHGNGFWNSGVLDTTSATPLPAQASVTFTAPGQYEFYCLIHPFMHGTVIVR